MDSIDCPKTERKIMIGTTAKSWKIRIEIEIRPCGVSISPLSMRYFRTIAVELSAITAPRKKPS